MNPSAPSDRYFGNCLEKLKVPGEGLLATQLQTGWENISSEKNLHGVIALACLIAGIQARFEGLFSEDIMEGCEVLPDVQPDGMREEREDITNSLKLKSQGENSEGGSKKAKGNFFPNVEIETLPDTPPDGRRKNGC